MDNTGRNVPLLSKQTYEVMMKYGDKINAKIDYSRDFAYDFFGFKTLEKSYLLRVADKKIAERP